MTGWLIRWGLLLAGFLLGCWWAGRTPSFDPDHAGCQATIGRLSAELADEIAHAKFLSRIVVAQQGYIDQLEHEQAIDGGATLAAETEAWLQGGGS